METYQRVKQDLTFIHRILKANIYFRFPKLTGNDIILLQKYIFQQLNN